TKGDPSEKAETGRFGGRPHRQRAKICSPELLRCDEFFEKFPPAVPDSEKSIILGMTPAAQETQFVRDTAAAMRLLETALVLNSEETCPVAE
ncbi:hypothetical protein A2U01_0078809, partial [Trifolium medium]|nr:hypothetical protein [Trifolium medium]